MQFNDSASLKIGVAPPQRLLSLVKSDVRFPQHSDEFETKDIKS